MAIYFWTCPFLCVKVERRDANTLLPLIQQYIRPGMTIASDMWRAYFNIDQLPDGYNHIMVNHSENFVNPLNPDARTQAIESLWQKFKMGHKKRYGTHETLFSKFLVDFVWRREFHGRDVMYHLWSQIAEIYPVEN